MDAALYAYPEVDRPWVRTNFVSTVDGAAYDVNGVTGSLGGDTDSEVFALLRALADVIVVGAGTTRIEGYRPSDVPLAVVSLSLDIPDVLCAPGQLVITTTDAPSDRLTALREAGVDLLARGEVEIDWAEVLADFDARGWRKVLCEGGPTLHGELLRHDLVDEVCLTIAPVVASGDAPRIAHSRHAVHHDMRLGHAETVGGVLLTRWVRDRT